MHTLPWRNHKDIHKKATPLPPAIIEGLLSEHELVIISAPEDSYKSHFAGELAWSIASKRDFLGRFPIRRSRMVGLIQSEIHPGFHDARMLKFPPCDRLETAHDPQWNLGVESDRKQLASLKHDVIILDPLQAVWPYDDKPPLVRISEQYNYFRTLTSKVGKTIILIHHHSKAIITPKGTQQSSAKGGAELRDAADTRIDILRDTVYGGANDGAKAKTATVRMVSRLHLPMAFRFIEEDQRLRLTHL